MGDVLVRPARPTDKETIKHWHSFVHGDNLQYPENWNPYNPRYNSKSIADPFRDDENGDYEDDDDGDFTPDMSHFEDLWDTWITDEFSQMYVAEMFGQPIALARVVQLSDIEVWWENIEENPSHKGQGMLRIFQYHVGKDLQKQGLILSRMGVLTTEASTIKQLEDHGVRPVASFNKFISRPTSELERGGFARSHQQSELPKEDLGIGSLRIEDVDDEEPLADGNIDEAPSVSADDAHSSHQSKSEGDGQDERQEQVGQSGRVGMVDTGTGPDEQPISTERMQKTVEKRAWSDSASLGGTFVQLTATHFHAAWDFLSESAFFDAAYSGLYRSVERCFQELTDLQLQLCIEEGRVFAYVVANEGEYYIESLSIVDDDADCWISLFLPATENTVQHFESLLELAGILGHKEICGQFPTGCESYLVALQSSRISLKYDCDD
eukprot:TRINITY_DN5423_c0_g1_i2.p1 TRINITY_DN5423_c0_g1~~TRINITY_DN5423_c0_g1_i2.p1  ORF type:complete len:438 (+),score=84.84 TRINITY_DN5423_c0_g1_i2:60-1373(+)